MEIRQIGELLELMLEKDEKLAVFVKSLMADCDTQKLLNLISHL